MNAMAETRHFYLDQYQHRQDNLPGARLPWLGDMRRTAMEFLAARGFPTRRDEDWKYTPADFLLQRQYAEADEAPDASVPALNGPAMYSMVFVNGRHRPELSDCAGLPEGITLMGMAEALAQHPRDIEAHLGQPDAPAHGFEALNRALFRDGAYIHLGPQVILDKPLLLRFLSHCDTPAMVHPRVLIACARGAQAQVVELHQGKGSYSASAVTDIRCAGQARLTHTRIQDEDPQSFHVGEVHARLDRDALLVSHSIARGARLSRIGIDVRLEGEGAGAELYGFYSADARRHVDHHTLIDHAAPRCRSLELYKGILDGASRGVFNGRVLVRAGAQKTDARQSNRNLLLSADAEVDTKPQLEIFADDVKCSHGATVGQPDREQLFYLQTRGLSECEARSLLVDAFAAEILGRSELLPLQPLLGAVLS